MSRRAVLSLAVVFLLVLVGAAVPWSLSTGGLAAAVTSHLRSNYGIELGSQVGAPSPVLPTPQIKFEQISLREQTSSLAAEGGTLRADIALLPLLLGRVTLEAVSLSDSQISATESVLRGQDCGWEVRGEAVRTLAVERIVIAGSSLRLTDRPQDNLDNINVVLAWSGPDDTLSLVGSAAWRGETVTLKEMALQPLAVAAGQSGRLTLRADLHAAHLAIDGVLRAGTDPQFTGRSVLKATSLRDFARWSSLDLPFGSLLRAVSVEGPALLRPAGPVVALGRR